MRKMIKFKISKIRLRKEKKVKQKSKSWPNLTEASTKEWKICGGMKKRKAICLSMKSITSEK